MATQLNSSVPSGMRLTVAIIGNANAGKSALLNQIVGQDTAIVSAVAGTTTDAVLKPYELIPVGPVCFYDTAGLDDKTELGEKRICATQKVIRKADLALLVIGKDGVDDLARQHLALLNEKKIPFIPVFNFRDLRQLNDEDREIFERYKGAFVSAKTAEGMEELKQRMIDVLTPLAQELPLLADLIKPKDMVLLVVPIDLAAPKGRLILPQVQALREILDTGAMPVVAKVSEVGDVLRKLNSAPDLVITDSQAVKEVAQIVPDTIPLTTFSTLFARYKGDFSAQLNGANTIDALHEGDKVLIAEGCSHHITCDDIGRVKIPNWILNYTGKNIQFDYAQGTDFPDNLNDYALVIHCGGCMLNRAEMRRRINECARQNIHVTNYGILISKMMGVLDRVIKPLGK